MSTLVLLPGLDGTGQLFEELSRTLEGQFRVLTLSYPTQQPMDYDGLLPFVRASLPDDDYIIIAESFSGPIALQIAQDKLPGLKGVVLGASFARLDITAKWILKILARILPPRLVPTWLLAPFLMGRYATPQLRHCLRQALAMVAPSVLGMRAQAALEVDLLQSGKTIDVPVLCLRATQDLLVPKTAAEAISQIANDVTIREITAPHFIFQIAVSECAAAILQFERNISERAVR